MIKAIVFDFGGVLIDWNPRHLYRKLFADENAMEQFFADAQFMEWNLEQDRGGRFAQGVAEHAEKFPQYAKHLRAFDERWRETVGGEISGTVEILRALKRAGHRLYGLTNWSAEKFALVEHEFSFLQWFDGIVVSGRVGLIKPEPRIFELLLEQIGLPARECLFIDDAEKNIAAARALGLHTIHFVSPAQLANELRALSLLPAP
jgi:2-haloacid dehalogenase